MNKSMNNYRYVYDNKMKNKTFKMDESIFKKVNFKFKIKFY